MAQNISAQRQKIGVSSAESLEKNSRSTDTHFVVPVPSIRRVEADGIQVFYREAGDPQTPVVLLLHGFPTSSFMFRELIPRLADRYRVIAPDLPGFGFTEVPEKRKYTYTFNALAATVDSFTKALQLDRYAIYVFDYGAPTGHAGSTRTE
jgi:pimeloyl-ACP methyl ester carboxylesterase